MANNPLLPTYSRTAQEELPDPNAADDRGHTNFEKACREPGKSNLVEEYARLGVDLQKRDVDGKRPIHLVATSTDPENIKTLLKFKTKLDINARYQKRTALHMLFERLLGEAHHEKIFECIKALLAEGADINILDGNRRTPIAVFLRDPRKIATQPWRKQVLKYCFTEANVDVDTFEHLDLRATMQKYCPDVELKACSVGNNLDVLTTLIETGTEDRFGSAFQSYKLQNESSWKSGLPELLRVAVEEGRLNMVKQLDNERTSLEASEYLEFLKICCLKGYDEILSFILEKINGESDEDIKSINSDPLLSMVAENMADFRDEGRYMKCLQILLADGRIEIDKTDEKGFSALHHAAKNGDDPLVHLLLEHSAYLGVRDRFGDLPMCTMDPNVLEEYLDSCVTTNKKHSREDTYEIMIDLACLVLPKYKRNYTGPDRNIDDEMSPLVWMAESKEFKHLLKHPVISIYILVRWLRLRSIFYFNFCLYLAFLVSFLWYTLACYDQFTQDWMFELSIASAMCTTPMLLREIFLCKLDGWRNYLFKENFLKKALIVTCWAAYIAHWVKHPCIFLSSIAILLSVLEFILLDGIWDRLFDSTYLHMLKKVSWNYLKALVPFIAIPGSFAFCFYILFKTKMEHSDQKAEDEKELNTFKTFGITMMKTVVMFTGETEAADTGFHSSFTSSVVFVLFIVFVVTVMSNLMIGLAVDDITAIKAKAELVGLSQKVAAIAYYEKAIESWRRIPRLSSCVPSKFKKLFPHRMIIAPNESSTGYSCIPSWISWIPSATGLDKKIVKHVEDIVRTRNRKNAQEQALRIGTAFLECMR